MKLTSHILPILAALAAFAACGSRTSAPKPVDAWLEQSPDGPAGQLCVVDSLMWQQPDSALTLLLDFAASPRADSLDVFNGHYFQLLLSELLYKNDYEQTNRPDLQRAVGYFDSIADLHGADTHGVSVWPFQRRDASNASAKTTAFLAARAHYINGVGYYERDSVVEACAEYMRALEVMDGHFEEKELLGHKARFMVYTYNRLGDLFSEQFMMGPSIDCYDNALVFCRIETTSTKGIANILMHLGLQYDKLGDKEKMRYYYEQALEEMPDEDSRNYRALMAIVALCDYQLGSGIEKPMKTLMEVLDKAKDESERLARYLTIGDIYYEEGQYDSALRYLKPVFEKQEEINVRVLVAGILHDIYIEQGDNESADKYAHYIVSQKKPEGENMVLVSKLETIFKEYKDQKQEKQAEKAREQSIRNTIKIIVPIAILAVLAIILASKYKSKKQLSDKERHHQLEMDSERQNKEIQLAALSGKLKKSKDELRELREQIGKQDDRGQQFSFAPSFKEEPVCRLIMERVSEGQFMSKIDCTAYKEYALSKEHLTELRKAADHHFNQFTVRISKAHPELTRLDLDYCCLYLLDLTDADISALMQRAYNTVNERNSKLRRIFGVDTSVAAALQAIANEF